MNSRETPKPIDIINLKDFNNFFDHLPGGAYRDRPKQKKLQDDLDREAKRLGIDAAALFTEMFRGHSEVMRGIHMMQEKGDSLEARKISGEGDAIRQAVHQKLIPLFEALVKLGHNPNELMT